MFVIFVDEVTLIVSGLIATPLSKQYIFSSTFDPADSPRTLPKMNVRKELYSEVMVFDLGTTKVSSSVSFFTPSSLYDTILK